MQLTFFERRSTSREKGWREKIYTAFRSLSKLYRGGTGRNPSSIPSLSSLAGGDDDKSSRDVATHNQIHPPLRPPLFHHLHPPSTGCFRRLRQRHPTFYEAATLRKIRHTYLTYLTPFIHLTLSPFAFRESNPRIPSVPLAACCPPQLEKWWHECACPPPVRGGIADSRRKEIPRKIRINKVTATVWKMLVAHVLQLA